MGSLIIMCDGGVGVGVIVGVGEGVTVGTGVPVGTSVGVIVGVCVGISVGISVGASVGTGVSVGIGVSVGSGVNVGSSVGVGIGCAAGLALFLGMEVDSKTKSLALLSVSSPFPPVSFIFLSILPPATGFGASLVSLSAAEPMPTLSTGVVLVLSYISTVLFVAPI